MKNRHARLDGVNSLLSECLKRLEGYKAQSLPLVELVHLRDISTSLSLLAKEAAKRDEFQDAWQLDRLANAIQNLVELELSAQKPLEVPADIFHIQPLEWPRKIALSVCFAATQSQAYVIPSQMTGGECFA